MFMKDLFIGILSSMQQDNHGYIFKWINCIISPYFHIVLSKMKMSDLFMIKHSLIFSALCEVTTKYISKQYYNTVVKLIYDRIVVRKTPSKVELKLKYLQNKENWSCSFWRKHLINAYMNYSESPTFRKFEIISKTAVKVKPFSLCFDCQSKKLVSPFIPKNIWLLWLIEIAVILLWFLLDCWVGIIWLWINTGKYIGPRVIRHP